MRIENIHIDGFGVWNDAILGARLSPDSMFFTVRTKPARAL